MTYGNCKKIIENPKYTYEYLINDMNIINKLDVFLLGSRITQEQYNELIQILNDRKEVI